MTAFYDSLPEEGSRSTNATFCLGYIWELIKIFYLDL